LYTSLSELIDLIIPSEVVLVEYEIDWDAPVSFIRLIHQDSTYELVTLHMNWICVNHEDSDCDSYCDYCDKNLAEATIVEYNAQTKEATVFVSEAGTYSLVFADYENNCLANVDIVEYEFTEGINVVPQEITTFTLASGDKVMLWHDMVNLVPVCDALTIN
jgi:hypothetical protein